MIYALSLRINILRENECKRTIIIFLGSCVATIKKLSKVQHLRWEEPF
jgi:hypothetical protein